MTILYGNHADSQGQLDDRWLAKKLILLCGSGGVGKTTISASLALQAALSGLKVLVVTIDPARRLATALGGINLGYTISEVDLSSLNHNHQGSLFAMMMDTKTAADELVGKFSPSPEIRDRVLDNRIYRTLSSSLSGSQEYVALGKLYELIYTDVYDLVVVDTAPTRYALDFFEGPTKLLDLLDNTILEHILSPVRRIHSKGFDFLKASSAFIAETLEKLLGVSLVSEVSNFIVSIESMLGGFRERSSKMHEVLQDSSKTSLGIVMTASQSSISESLLLFSRLRELNMPVDFMALNRVHPQFFATPELVAAFRRFTDDQYVLNLLQSTAAERGLTMTNELVLALRRGLKSTYKLGLEHGRQIELVKQKVGSAITIVQLPFFETDICDLDGLAKLGSLLIAPSKGRVNDSLHWDSWKRDEESSPAPECSGESG